MTGYYYHNTIYSENVERIDYSNIMPWETGTSEEIEDEIDLFFGRYDTNTKRKSSSGGSSGSKSDGSDLSKEGEGLDSNEEEQSIDSGFGEEELGLSSDAMAVLSSGAENTLSSMGIVFERDENGKLFESNSQDKIVEKSGEIFIERDGKEYALASSSDEIKFDPALPSEVCVSERRDITVKGETRMTFMGKEDCLKVDGSTFRIKIQIMEADSLSGDDTIATKYLSGNQECDSVDDFTIYYEYTFEDVQLGSQFGGAEDQGTIEVYAIVEPWDPDYDKTISASTPSYDVDKKDGCCECSSGTCCDGCNYKSDNVVCDSYVSGSDQEICTSNCIGGDIKKRYKKQYCSGSSNSCDGLTQWVESQFECGNSNYCDGSTSSWKDPLDIYCSSPQCTSGICCDSTCGVYEFKSSDKQCDARIELACPWGEVSGDDVGKRTNIQYCSGNSISCNGDIDNGPWFVQDYCSFNEFCVPGNPECQGVISCSSASDCGENGYIGSPWCGESGDVIRQVFTTYTCHNPGTTNSYCTSIGDTKVKEICEDDSCDNWGSNFCENGDAYHSRTCHDNGCDPIQIAENCFDNINVEKEKIEECGSNGCGNGQCTGGGLSNAFWENMRMNGITNADLGDRVVLFVRGSGLAGKHINFTIYKTGALLSYVVVAQTDTSIFTDWRASPSGTYYFKAKLVETGQEIQSQNLVISNTEDNSPPIAVYLPPPNNGAIYFANQEINFNQASYDEDDYFDSWWYFDDGTVANGVNTTHSYYSSGQRNIYINLTDERKASVWWPAVSILIIGGCTSHLYSACNDGDVYWYDSCNNREDKKEECGSNSCSEGECNEEIRCSSHKDCGENGYLGNPICQNDDIYDIFRIFICENKGTPSAYCSSGDSLQKIQECGLFGCSGGQCNTCSNECSISGDKRCSGDIEQTCSNYDLDSCLEWGGDVDCEFGCSGNSCNELEEMTINLPAGRSIFSLPLEYPNEEVTFNDLNSNCVVVQGGAGSVCTGYNLAYLNPQNGEYVCLGLNDELFSGQGYFVRVLNSCNLIVKGEELSSDKIGFLGSKEIKKGENLIGAPTEGVNFNSVIGTCQIKEDPLLFVQNIGSCSGIQYYSGKEYCKVSPVGYKYCYCSVSRLVPGKGYNLYSYNKCEFS